MNSPGTSQSLFRTLERFKRWLFRRRTLRLGLSGLAVLAGLVAVWVIVEDIRGAWAWHAVAAEAKAKGEYLAVKSIIPPTVPNDQNFAMTPLLKSLFNFRYDPKTADLIWGNTNSAAGLTNFERVEGRGEPANWREARLSDVATFAESLRAKPGLPSANSNQPPAAEILAAMRVIQPELKELREASQRPYSRFPLQFGNGFPVVFPQFLALKAITWALTWRTIAEIALGDRGPAFRDARFGLSLSQKLRDEPMLVSQLVMDAQIHIALIPLYEGLARQFWSDKQLADLEADLGQIDLFRSLHAALRGERNLDLSTTIPFWEGAKRSCYVRLLRTCLLSGWFELNKAALARLYLQVVPTIVDFQTRRFYPGRAQRLAAKLAEPHTDLANRTYAEQIYPNIEMAVRRAAATQTWIDEAYVACALERYRLKYGSYPEQLNALVPGFLPALPRDVCTGKPLKYRRTRDKQFVLYSVGANLKDDGGHTGFDQSSSRREPILDLDYGDWIWAYPAAKVGAHAAVRK